MVYKIKRYVWFTKLKEMFGFIKRYIWFTKLKDMYGLQN